MYFKTKESLQSNHLYATSQPLPPLAKAARPTSKYLENLQPQEILECPLCPQIHGSAYNISKTFWYDILWTIQVRYRKDCIRSRGFYYFWMVWLRLLFKCGLYLRAASISYFPKLRAKLLQNVTFLSIFSIELAQNDANAASIST